MHTEDAITFFADLAALSDALGVGSGGRESAAVFGASGFALRFPRILRIRDDKPLDEIDTLDRVEAIYQSQPDKGGE